MSNPLPVREIRGIIGDKGFLRLYGQDTFLYVSDLPRRVPADALVSIRQSLHDHGFLGRINSAGLLLIDLRPARWEAFLDAFPSAGETPFPHNESLHGVYALARLLSRHPSEFALQPADMVRAVLKRYAVKDELAKLAPRLHASCAERLRRGQPLPSALAKVLFFWLGEQSDKLRQTEDQNNVNE